MSEVELEKIVKIFPGGTKALDEIDLSIKDRELMVILGPSGCGKSTLLRIVAGLEKATDGRVLIDAQDVTEQEPGTRDIAMVFQNYELYRHMTVFKNIAYGLKNRKKINIHGTKQNECDFLSPLFSSLEQGISLADEMLIKYNKDWSKNIKQIDVCEFHRRFRTGSLYKHLMKS